MRMKLVAAGLLFLAVGFVLWKAAQRRPAADAAGTASVASDASLSRLTVESTNGLVALGLDVSGWFITAPVRARADASAVSKVVDGLQSLRPDSVAAADRTEAGPYGLDASTIVVHSTWTTPSGSTSEHVHTIGAAVPGGTYFTVDTDPRVFLGPEGLREAFSRPYNELRDRSVLAFDPATVRGLFVQMGEQRWFVERMNDGWKRTKPSEGAADKGAVESVLTMLAQAKARDHVDDRRPSDMAALNALGFSSPSALVTLVQAAGSRTLLVAESEASGGHRVYAREAAGGPVMVVDGAVLETLRTAMASGTMLMPTTSAPRRPSIRISAGVSSEGPGMAA
jgi:hypothetical protein